jgi:DNA-binding NtrC family response regulator
MVRLRKEPAKDGPVVLLVLSCPERQARLAAILRALGVDLLCLRQCWEARALLQTRPPLLSVVTDAMLADGNWRDVLRTVVDYDPQAGVILIAPSSADEMLWSEAMWLGVHDILVEPFTETEAQQVVECVLRVAGAQQHRLIGDSRSEQQAAVEIRS